MPQLKSNFTPESTITLIISYFSGEIEFSRIPFAAHDGAEADEDFLGSSFAAETPAEVVEGAIQLFDRRRRVRSRSVARCAF